MADLTLQAGDDHVARLAHEGDPVRAIVELIWNAIDAEASEVTVELEHDSELGAITKTTVTDNGHGISVDEVPTTFGRIGDSWKKRATKTKNGRRGLHGQLGEGRLRVFALGNRVEWSSHSIDTAGVHQRIEIRGSTQRRQTFPWKHTPVDSGPTGTTVTAWNESQKSLGALDAEGTATSLLTHFAPILLNDEKLAITYSGKELDPADNITAQTTIPLEFGEGATRQTGSLLIIEWTTGKHRSLHFGPDEQHFVYEESAKDLEPQFQYSAYVTWAGLDHDAVSRLPLGELAQDEVADLVVATREAIKAHFTQRRMERRREQVKTWKKNKVYPYEGEPKNDADRAERAVFDVVSGAISTQISSKKSDAKLTLALLQKALRQDPDNLTTILHEVVALTDKDRDTLTKLLSETTLPAIIKAANLVASRHKFLEGLEHLLFDPDDSGKVGERDHLHRILERELWIFGEAYHVMSSERGLTEMLRNQLKLEGLPTKGVTPVKRWDGRSGRVDLHLAVKSQEFDRTHHLVIELKAPGITLGRAELDQVEDYANVVMDNAAFASDRATWEFVLVGTGWDTVAENRISTEHRETGQFYGPPAKSGGPTVRAYVRKWRDVLDENKRRLAFMTNALEHDPTLEEGLGHLRSQYADLLPAELGVPARNP